MWLKKHFALIVAAFILAVGVLFLSSAMFELSFLKPAAAGKIAFPAIAAVFIAAGIVFIVMHQRGSLKVQGKPIKEIRKEAVAKLESEELLADIALNDPITEIRETAKQRLQDLQQ
jgi:hypothetical protein